MELIDLCKKLDISKTYIAKIRYKIGLSAGIQGQKCFLYDVEIKNIEMAYLLRVLGYTYSEIKQYINNPTEEISKDINRKSRNMITLLRRI